MAHLLCLTAFLCGFGVLVKDAWYKSSDGIWYGLEIIIIALAGFFWLVGSERRAEKELLQQEFNADRDMRDRACLLSLEALIGYLFPNFTTVLSGSQTGLLNVYLAASDIDPLFSVTVTNDKGFCFHPNYGGYVETVGIDFLIDVLKKASST